MHVWRDRLGRLFHPLAARIPWSPNTITTLALFLNLCAAATLASAATRPYAFLVAVGLISIGGLADALDGAVARAQNRATRWGDFLDHLFDRISDLSLFVGWIIGARLRPEVGLIALLAVMINGYIGTQVEATFGKREYETVGRGEFVLALVAFPLVAYGLRITEIDSNRYLHLTILEWITVFMGLFAMVGTAQRFQQAWRLSKEPE